MKRSMQQGFTLVEMLLVLVIIAAIIVAVVGYTEQQTDRFRRDRAIQQIQQIENAALAYYVANSSWPSQISDLKNAGFLPNITITNPYSNNYYIKADTTAGTFAVCTTVTMSTKEDATMAAQVIAGGVPLGYLSDTAATSCAPNLASTTSCSTANCTVVSFINIPSMNLNNARSVNFAGVYNNGGCVPVPTCPGATSGTNAMTPAIIVAPVSASGAAASNSVIYPIESFTASATGSDPLDATPPWCPSQSTAALTVSQNCNTTSTSASPSGKYWRVCLQVITSAGDISKNTSSGQISKVLAITRCVPNNEPYGTNFTIYQH